ncbi:hypothetical protein ACNTMW_31130 [Planosporangium sp. 12N6]|uniref:hypothetical protein n=1 Tax=Planosporangium spinosum TaxID=3402278 RepID=UPI003CF4DF27
MQYRYTWRAVANGMRTDHPLPELPFVDDTHIPVDDPVAIERIGRKKSPGMWGREDQIHNGGWVAFTTDPVRTDLAWCVRWHPEHGRSVVLYADGDAASAYMAYWGPALLFRAGGYWWDGQTWYRPAQVWDAAGETYVRRAVPAATTVTAADLRAVAGDPARAQVLSIIDVDSAQPLVGRWADHLALWTAGHVERGGQALDRCVISLTAPELAADQLVGVAELAQIAGVAASTLRAYLARGENDIPLPQATVTGRNLWSRPVAEEYAEARQQDPDAIASTMSAQRGEVNLPRGTAELWQRFSRKFLLELWEKPAFRRRWALRWRTEPAIREVAEGLGWQVAGHLDQIVPMTQLATTIRYAILGDLSGQQTATRELHRFVGADDPDNDHSYGLTPAIARMLAWYIRHDPAVAHAMLAETIGQAERELDIPRGTTADTLHTAVDMDGHLTDDDREAFADFFDRLLPKQEP